MDFEWDSAKELANRKKHGVEPHEKRKYHEI